MASVPTAEIDVVNMALDFCAVPPIKSISPPDGRPNSLIVARHYESARQSVLRTFIFQFAKGRAITPNLGVVPEFDFLYQFGLPADYLRLMTIDGPGYRYANMNYDMETNDNGQKVLLLNPFMLPPLNSNNPIQPFYPGTGFSNTPVPGSFDDNAAIFPAGLKIRYIKDITDISIWDADAKEVLAAKLCENVALAITKSEKMHEMAVERMARFIPDAISISGQERPPIRVERSKAIGMRRGLMGSGSTSTAGPNMVVD